MGQRQASQQAQVQEQQHQAELQTQKAQMEAQMAQQKAQSAGSANVDVTAEIQKLAQLHQSGVLTDEEFAVAKQKLLSK
jgi:hypothetical protein